MPLLVAPVGWSSNPLVDIWHVLSTTSCAFGGTSWQFPTHIRLGLGTSCTCTCSITARRTGRLYQIRLPSSNMSHTATFNILLGQSIREGGRGFLIAPDPHLAVLGRPPAADLAQPQLSTPRLQLVKYAVSQAPRLLGHAWHGVGNVP